MKEPAKDILTELKEEISFLKEEVTQTNLEREEIKYNYRVSMQRQKELESKVEELVEESESKSRTLDLLEKSKKGMQNELESTTRALKSARDFIQALETEKQHLENDINALLKKKGHKFAETVIQQRKALQVISNVGNECVKGIEEEKF